MDRNTIQKILIGLLLLTCLLFGFVVYEEQLKVVNPQMDYSRLLDYLTLGWVEQVDLYNNSRHAVVEVLSPEFGDQLQSIDVELPVGAQEFIGILKECDINFDAHPAQPKSIVILIISNLLLPLIFITSLIFFFSDIFPQFSSNSSPFPMGFGGFGGFGSLGKSTARYEQNPDTGISFNDIAGIDEAKEDFKEIVSFLEKPELFTRVGATIPKGVLLLGPPGTGKTLLAKAIANEAKVPFYIAAGSEFVEMFIGIGAARVRDLFKRASETTPCVIFIDEIDAIGRERGSGIAGGNDEREQTLNQLLTELDGFRENKGVILVGATNRIDILDPALLRPGRFDRQITVNLPDRLGRIGILKVHARNKPLAEDVSLIQLANRTSGFSGADLSNLLNEAAILATRHGKQSITKNEVNEAAERMIGGIAGTEMDDSKNKKLIAYHEIGHAIVGALIKDHDKVEKITLIPRGNAKGLTWFIPEEDQILLSRSQLLARIAGILGGRIAEQVIFGNPEVSTGANNDFQKITMVARQMVSNYGMSNLGPVFIEDDSPIFFDDESDKLNKDKVTNKSYEIIDDCEQVVTEIILNNRLVIDLVVEKLLDTETIDGEEFSKLISKYTILPV